MSSTTVTQSQVSALYSSFDVNQKAYKNYLTKLKAQLTSVKGAGSANWTEDDWMNWQNYWGDLSSIDTIDTLEQTCKQLQQDILSAHPLPE